MMAGKQKVGGILGRGFQTGDGNRIDDEEHSKPITCQGIRPKGDTNQRRR